MAKADVTSSTTDWVWLHDALMLAVPRFGSVVLAKMRLKEWLAAGRVPWSCMSWEGLDAASIARLDRENRLSIVFHIIPSVAYHEGDPQFWHAASLKIYWEENGARENAVGGARAMGIRVSRTSLLALLPELARDSQETLRQTKTAEHKSTAPKAWLAETLKKYPRGQGERVSDYVERLHALMQEADVTDLWQISTLRRRLYD